jgi:hypothetical protein
MIIIKKQNYIIKKNYKLIFKASATETDDISVVIQGLSAFLIGITLLYYKNDKEHSIK